MVRTSNWCSPPTVHPERARGRLADGRRPDVSFARDGHPMSVCGTLDWDTDNAAALMNLIAVRESGQRRRIWATRKAA